MNTIGNTANVKQLNRELIKEVLKSDPGKTKAGIASATGLSQATCNTILNELVAAGEVIELDKEIINGGRPAKQYQYNADYANIVCLTIENDNRMPVINYSVLNLSGDILEKISFQKEIIDSDAIDQLYDTIDRIIEQILKKYPKIKAIGFGIPGVVLSHRFISYCDIKALKNCPLAELVENKYGIKVILENDMNLTVLGFYKERNYPEETSIVVLTFIKGNLPGSGIIINGHIVRGNSNFAGEVAYLPFDCTLKQQAALLKTKEGVFALTVKSICSIAAVINPHSIVLTGSLLSEDMLADIHSHCCNIIPKEHMPKLIYEKEIYDYYLAGLAEMTLDSLSYPIKIIKKKI